MIKLSLPHSLEGRLAVLALLLGAGALLGTAIVETEVDRVTVQELADWIIQGKGDVRILDLRSPAEYAEYYIPGAENVTVTQLAEYPLYRNEQIVMYSGGGIHFAQGLVPAAGARLSGCLHAPWWSRLVERRSSVPHSAHQALS
jgi:hypothetical protein